MLADYTKIWAKLLSSDSITATELLEMATDFGANRVFDVITARLNNGGAGQIIPFVPIGGAARVVHHALTSRVPDMSYEEFERGLDLENAAMEFEGGEEFDLSEDMSDAREETKTEEDYARHDERKERNESKENESEARRRDIESENRLAEERMQRERSERNAREADERAANLSRENEARVARNARAEQRMRDAENIRKAADQIDPGAYDDFIKRRSERITNNIYREPIMEAESLWHADNPTSLSHDPASLWQAFQRVRKAVKAGHVNNRHRRVDE